MGHGIRFALPSPWWVGRCLKGYADQKFGRGAGSIGVAPPSGVAAAFLHPVDAPVEALLARWARTHGPFTAAAVAARYGMVESQARSLLAAIGAPDEPRLLKGEFTPGGTVEEWIDAEVLRQIKRRTIAKLRGEVAPVSRETLARFLPAWHRVAGDDPHESLADAIVQLEGIPLGYRELVRVILPARVRLRISDSTVCSIRSLSR